MLDISSGAKLWGELYGLMCRHPELRKALGSLTEWEAVRLDDLAEEIIQAFLIKLTRE